MVCPHCKKNSMPFFKVWLLGDFRTFTCPECGKKSKQKISKILFLFFVCLGYVVAGFILNNFTLGGFILILVVALIIGAVLEYKFGKLVPVD